MPILLLANGEIRGEGDRMGLVCADDGWRIPDSLWAKRKPDLPPPKPHPLGCHNPPVPARAVMNAILFVLRTGCQWKALDATGLCKSSTAHRWFQEWRQAGVFLKFWKRGLLSYEKLKGIEWDWLAMDGAMTKAPLGGEKTGPNPTDRAKTGVKRSLLSDGAGIPLGLAIDGANRNDFRMARQTLQHIPVHRPLPTKENPQGRCMDKGYDYDEVLDLLYEFHFTAHIRSRGEEAQAIKKKAGFKARRWVVERTHSWMNRFRGILIRWAKKAENYLGLLHLVCGLITGRSIGLFDQ